MIKPSIDHAIQKNNYLKTMSPRMETLRVLERSERLRYFYDELETFVDDRIVWPYVDRGKPGDCYDLCVDKLPDELLSTLASHFIRYDNLDLHSLFVDDYPEITSALIKYMMSDDPEDGSDFSHLVQKKIIQYYLPQMKHVIADRVQTLQTYEYEEELTYIRGYSDAEND